MQSSIPVVTADSRRVGGVIIVVAVHPCVPRQIERFPYNASGGDGQVSTMRGSNLLAVYKYTYDKSSAWTTCHVESLSCALVFFPATFARKGTNFRSCPPMILAAPRTAACFSPAKCEKVATAQRLVFFRTFLSPLFAFRTARWCSVQKCLFRAPTPPSLSRAKNVALFLFSSRRTAVIVSNNFVN